MIKKIVYKIRFPFGADFKKDPEILFINKIYKEIYKATCTSNDQIEKNRKCNECNKKDRCIFYYLTGENFNKYPSICVKRNTANKKNYSSNDILKLTFYLIGAATYYSEFITAFFDYEEYIVGNYFQKVIIENNILNNELYEGKIYYENVVVDVEDIVKSINYYNEKYKCNFLIPNINEIKSLNFCDNNKYTICEFTIKVNGKIGLYDVKNYSKELMECGVGKYNFIGGGRGKCVLK